MRLTYVNFWDIQPGRREQALSCFTRVKAAAEGLGATNARYRMVTTGENTGLYYGLFDAESISEYGRMLDRSIESSEMKAVMAETGRADSPVVYRGNWVMTEVARSSESTVNERAFMIRNWDVTPGREDDFFSSFEQVSELMRQFGGVHVIYRIAFGGDMSGTYSATVGFPDFASLYAFHEHSSTSEAGKRIRQHFHEGTPPATSRSIMTAVAVPLGGESPSHQDMEGC